MSLANKNPSRLALVIGNSAYVAAAPLPNAANDAALIAARLEEVGIEVHRYQNLDRPGMDRAIDNFTARMTSIGGVDTAIFYFSGHGFQDADVNYLLPCEEKDQADAVSLQEWIDRISRGSRRRLVFLDACRSYFDAKPVENAIARSRGLTEAQKPNVRRGLADFEAADDTFISFSAAPGKPAYDGVEGRENSPYADALARFIHEVDLPLTVLMARVRNSVRSDTEHFTTREDEPAYQKTWDSSSLRSGFFFNPSSLLFLLGNALALLASVVALLTFGTVLYEAAVAEFVTGENRWLWTTLTLMVFFMTIGVFLFGVGRAYSRVRGEAPDWQREGDFELFKWSSAGAFGAIGGMLGGVIASACVIVPYWYDWRTEDTNPWIVAARCSRYPWAYPQMPELCPKLGQLLAEGTLAGIFILTILGFFAMHFIEWMTRGRPARFFDVKRPVLVFAGAMLGGMVAGAFIGPVITAYFGSQDRPFLEPGFVIPFSVVAVAVMAFCIANYSLETFTLKRLGRSAVGALVGTVCAIVLLGAIIGLLYLSGFIQTAYDWANSGFYDETQPMFQRYAYLLVAGLPYGMCFGIGFGALIAATRTFTDPGTADVREIALAQ